MEEIALMLKERSKQISVESRAALKKVLEQRTRLFALNIQDFTSLSSHDQVLAFIDTSKQNVKAH
jgi:hypothetical protein